MYIVFVIFLPVLLAENAENGGEKKININKKHLAADIFDLFGMWSDAFSEKEMDLQYFATHDFDNNKKLDGLELFKAMSHSFSDEDENHTLTNTEKDTESEVDSIFSEYDKDNDGFLDYEEFAGVLKVHEETKSESNQTTDKALENSKRK